MAGSITIIDTAAAIAADRSVAIDGGGGAHEGALFYVDVTAITANTGSLTVSTLWKTLDGVTTTIATITGITGTGVTKLTNTAAVFDNTTATTRVVPAPNGVTWDLVGTATAVSGKLYAMYSD